MAILNPDHFFEQADFLIAPRSTGRRRQVDLRRAISGAYYGVFHATLTAAADRFAGASKRSTSLYSLVYRSIDHRKLREVCEEVIKPALPQRLVLHAPSGGFDEDMKDFALAVIEFQKKRHQADYDASIEIKTLDAGLAVATARLATQKLAQAASPQRESFLALLLFTPR